MRENDGSKRVGDLGAFLRLVGKLPVNGDGHAARNRRMVVELCKLLGTEFSGGVAPHVSGLSPRMRQTLELLVRGDSERQIALKLKISPHTVHVYVKQLYKRFNANSRGELLSRFIRGNHHDDAT
jgi:DNA-binding CsgD family transcriptional regulator